MVINFGVCAKHETKYMYITECVVLQMIELIRDPTGEVEITSAPKGSQAKTAAFANTTTSSEDEAKITELRSQIISLKTQIEASLVFGIQ